jgi:putative DNA primase/helicase
MSRERRTSDDRTDYEPIPDELKDRDQWLLWDASADTPRRPHWKGDFGISWSNPDEWHSFEDAVDAVTHRDSWGIGYVMATDNGDHSDGTYACIDIDGGYDGNGDLRNWVPNLDRFTDAGTYMEFSPSGNGVHIPIYGTTVPDWWSDCQIDDHEGVDVLTNKFCTFTGDTHPDSGDAVEDVNPAGWLFQAYNNIRGEAPPIGDATADKTGWTDDAGDDSDDYDGDEWLTDDAVEDALSHIDPDVPHTEWIRLAYSVHDYDSGGTGQRIFEDWSKDGNKYDDAAKRSIESIWSDASAGSSVTVATLIHKAKKEDWDPPTPQPTSSRSKGGGSAAKTPLADAIESDWFNTDSQVVRVQATADYDAGDLVEVFENPDDLSTDVILAVNETAGGSEFLDAPGEWTVRQRNPSEYAVFAEWTIQELKEKALHELPTDRLAWVPEREAWYWCDDAGIWHDYGEEYIRQRLDDLFGPHYRRQLRNEVEDQLKARVRADQHAFGGGPPGTIATESGLVDLETGECRLIKPDDRVRWTLGTEYDPDADCPQWKAFLGDVAEPSDIPILQEFVGYCLHHWDLPLKKALIIFGPTDAGKSIFLDVVRALFGGDDSPATSSTSIQYLANERWGPARLVNTAVNIRNDLSSETIQNTGKVKELIGGDTLDAEYKRKPVFNFAPTAKHIFAANRAPDRSTDDEAFWNRWLTVIFPESVPKKKQTSRSKLTADLEAELPGILNWVIEGYRRLMQSGRFTNEPLPFENRDRWERYGNSIEQWLDRCTEQEPDATTPKWTTDDGTLGAYDSYKAFAQRNGLEVETDRKFTRELKQREGISKQRLTVDGGRPWGYRGFRLTDDAPEPDRDESDDDDSDDPDATGLSSFGDQ